MYCKSTSVRICVVSVSRQQVWATLLIFLAFLTEFWTLAFYDISIARSCTSLACHAWARRGQVCQSNSKSEMPATKILSIVIVCKGNILWTYPTWVCFFLPLGPVCWQRTFCYRSVRLLSVISRFSSRKGNCSAFLLHIVVKLHCLRIFHVYLLIQVGCVCQLRFLRITAV